jgi:hypothetical protein
MFLPFSAMPKLLVAGAESQKLMPCPDVDVFRAM